MKTILVLAALALAAAPLVIAQGGSTGCSGGIGVFAASCTFECEEGQNLSVYVDGIAIITARCGGAEACNFQLCSGNSHVSSYGWGTCEVFGYVWLSYGCSSS